MSRFNIRDYGATGRAADDAQPAIQSALDACAASGGGMVYVPPGQYTTGTLNLRSHVRLYLEAGATILSSKDPRAFTARGLLYGRDLEDVSIEGRGTVDGQAQYEWRLNDHEDRYIWDNMKRMEASGKPLERSFPTADSVGNLVLVIRCQDLRITGVSFLRSPSWTMHLYACERVLIDSIYVHTSLTHGVWADGIDPDGCRDVRISNSTIETGDDALVFYSANIYGPALPCENITVTNCRLTSSSSALKFCDGNQNCIRNVLVDNCLITNSNRGIAFMVYDGGYVSDVVLSNLVIECTRRDWFWWGDGDPFHFNIRRRSEVHQAAARPDEPQAGSIRNVLIQNVLARGTGPSVVNGHPDSWLENVAFENVKLEMTHDPLAPYEKTDHALSILRARNLRLRDVEVRWGEPAHKGWKSALYLEDIEGLQVDGLCARQAGTGSAEPTVLARRVKDGLFRRCRAEPGTGTFLRLEGASTADIVVQGNDFRHAAEPCALGAEVKAELTEFGNLTRASAAGAAKTPRKAVAKKAPKRAPKKAAASKRAQPKRPPSRRGTRPSRGKGKPRGRR